jgi:hypothetical protein
LSKVVGRSKKLDRQQGLRLARSTHPAKSSHDARNATKFQYVWRSQSPYDGHFVERPTVIAAFS